MDIFRFEIDTRVGNHGDSGISVYAALKIERFNEYYKILTEMSSLISQRDKAMLLTCKRLRGKSLSYDLPLINDLVQEVKDSLSYIKKVSESIGILDSKLLVKIKDVVDCNIVGGKEGVRLDNLYENLEEIVLYIEDLLSKTLEMFDKLKLLEGKPLRIIILFSEDGYETQFTKYHINLEHFGDKLHSILRDDFEKSLYLEFKKLEATFKSVARSLDNPNIPVEAWIKSVNLGSKLVEKMRQDYPEVFLKAQPYYSEMMLIFEAWMSSLNKIYTQQVWIYNFSGKIYSDNYKKHKALYLRMIYLAHQYTLGDFLVLQVNDLKSILEDSFRVESGFIQEEYDIVNISLIDPELGEMIRKNIIKEVQNQMGYNNIVLSKGYMWKKAERGLFDNRQFYSHKICCYKFLDEDKFIDNKFIKNQGTDAVKELESILQRRGEVYSKVLRKMIKYTCYLNVQTYYSNLNGNFIEVSLKDSKESMDKKFKKGA